jgi:hypothetical protein
MTPRFFRLAAAGLLILASGGVVQVHSAEPAAETAQIEQWVEQLGSRNLNERRDAIEKLADTDAKAVPSLKKGIEAGNPDSVRSGTLVLRMILRAGSEEGRKAAREALESLSESRLPQVSNAARSALNPADGATPVPARRPLRVNVNIVNGARTMSVQETDRTVTITDTAGKDITVRIETIENGEPVAKEFKGDNAEDLKTKHPEASELYERYGQLNGQQFRIQALGFPGMAPPQFPGGIPQPPFPGRRGGLPGLPGRDFGDANERIESALKTIAEARDRLKEIAAQDRPAKEDLEKLSDDLKQAEKELFSAQESLKP